MPLDNCPILVGCGQTIQREIEDLAEAKGPIDMMCEAARNAEDDAGAKLLASVDTLRIVQFMSGTYEHPEKLLSERLGMKPTQATMTARTGGNSPQRLVNETAEQLARGESRLALLCGAEVLDSYVNSLKQGVVPKWLERDGAAPAVRMAEFEATSEYETPYDLQLPTNVYPLFENALRVSYGWDLATHQRKLGELMAPFSEIAAKNPFAWFPLARSAEEIATVSPNNRYVGFPYTKYLNAIIRVDQGAAVFMTTVGAARELGIGESRWVYLHGCADAQDHWYLSDRENYHSSPGIRANAREAFQMAGWDQSDLDHIDLYSCFPSAVQVARDEIGIPQDDPRPLTVTGGLPYHGGPANNYVMHSIATTMNLLRDQPGAKGLCTGLGWFMTKHSMGLYSTEPFEGSWERKDIALYQKEIDASKGPTFTPKADGAGTVETYTVLHGREGAEKAILYGRLEDGTRFLARTPNSAELFTEMTEVECIGRKGRVASGNGVNVFEFD